MISKMENSLKMFNSFNLFNSCNNYYNKSIDTKEIVQNFRLLLQRFNTRSTVHSKKQKMKMNKYNS